jgi:S1-C subfamily serine protease
LATCSLALVVCSSACLLVALSFSRADDDLDDLHEKAIKAAVRQVAPCVVQIETSGGTEVVTTGGPRNPLGPGGMIRVGTGPTTGLIVHPDGYVISSSFNFASKPSAIHVAVPGHPERYVAEVVASDTTRMLTLLKLIGVNGTLPVPAVAPKKDMRIGQTSLAVGRTLAGPSNPMPSVSVGILSALNRIWAKAIQTDAKVSPTNYGGPLIDLYGRVLGVLVPASPRSEGETAGFEWYDSGIGFAIPLEDINRVLPRMLKGTKETPVTLKRGLMGINMQAAQGQDANEAPPTIANVSPGSAAEKRGLKAGDTVKEINGKPIATQPQLQQALGPLYEGDVISLKVQRGKEEVKFDKFVLEGAVAAHAQPFLGILPIRDDPEPGVEVRYVYPGSPAEKAGIKAGDRVMKVGREMAPGRTALQPVQGRDQLISVLEGTIPGLELSFEVKRADGKKTETLKLKLGEIPETVPTKDQLPEKATAKKALVRPKGAGPAPKKEDKKDDKKDKEKAETGLIKRTTAAADHTYWLYVPDNYDPNIAHAVLVWLHPPGKNKEKDFDKFSQAWQFPCEDFHIIVVCPATEAERGWTQSESEFIQEALRAVSDEYTIDKSRMVVHGMDRGGEMAFWMGFHSRGLFRGVATTGAALTSNPREKVANQPLNFFLVVGDKDPLWDAVKETKAKLTEFKYSVIFREIKDMGRQYIDSRIGIDTLDEMARWIDSLDRL